MIAGRDGQRFIVDEIYDPENIHKKVDRPRVQDEARLRTALGPLADYRDELGYIISLSMGEMGYPSEAGFLPKIRGMPNDKYREWVKTALGNYKDWRVITSQRHKGIVTDVCYFRFSARECAFQRSSHTSTIMKYLREGLEHWRALRP